MTPQNPLELYFGTMQFKDIIVEYKGIKRRVYMYGESQPSNETRVALFGNEMTTAASGPNLEYARTSLMIQTILQTKSPASEYLAELNVSDIKIIDHETITKCDLIG